MDILKIATTGLTGLFAGGALFVNIVSIPSLRKVRNDTAVLEYWKEFVSTPKWQYQWFGLFDKSDKRYLWCIGTVLLATKIPWTLFLMNPDRDQLFEDKVIRKRGEHWVRTKIEAWNKKHMYRSFICLFVFGTYLYAQGSQKESWWQYVDMNHVGDVLSFVATKCFGYFMQGGETKGAGGLTRIGT